MQELVIIQASEPLLFVLWDNGGERWRATFAGHGHGEDGMLVMSVAWHSIGD
jgi:hypothetical protein